MEKNLFEIFEITIDKELMVNPTPKYNNLIEAAIKKKIHNWEKLSKKNLGKKSDQAKLYLKKVNEERIHNTLVNPIQRKEYFLKLKEEKKQELSELIVTSTNYNQEKSLIHKRFTNYLTENEMIEVEKQVEKEEQNHPIFNEEIIKKLIDFQEKISKIPSQNLLDTLEIKEEDSYKSVKTKIERNKEEKITEYEESINRDGAVLRIKSDLLIGFSTHVLGTEEFKRNFKQYMQILRYSSFIASLNAIRGKDITNTIYKKLIDQADREQLNKAEFINFLLNIYTYFDIKGVNPLINYLKTEMKHDQQNVKEFYGQKAKDFEYNKGREAIAAGNPDEAFKHFENANRFDPGYALFELGELYYVGTAEVRKDRKKALTLYEKAENHVNIGENKNALYRLGRFYLSRRNLDNNPALGLRYLSRFVVKVNKGDVSANPYYGLAYLKLGDCYHIGRGADQNLRKALECYEKAAKVGNTMAKQKAKKLQRELTMKSKVIASISIISVIALMIVSLNLMEEIFAGSLTQKNVYLYFGIIFTWMVVPKLFIHNVYPHIRDEKWNLLKRLRVKEWEKPKLMMRYIIMLYGAICFWFLWKGGYILPWLSEEDTRELPQFLNIILNFGINYTTIAIIIQMIFPLWILSKETNNSLVFKQDLRKPKQIMKLILVIILLIGGVYEAFKIETENILTGFSFMDYFISLGLLGLATLPFNNSTIIERLIGKTVFPIVFFVLLFYGTLVCALVAESGFEIPLFSTAVQVALITLLCKAGSDDIPY